MNPEEYYKIVEENPDDYESAKKVRFHTPVKLERKEISAAVIARGTFMERNTAIFHNDELLIEAKNELQVLLHLFARSENYDISIETE